MRITYELNPPKLINGQYFDPLHLRKNIDILINRSSQLCSYADGIHLTDSVLGVPRLSSITMAQFIKRSGNTLDISCSVRVRDRNFTSTCQFVCDAILTQIKSLLIIFGDEPIDGPKDSGLKPSKALKMLKQEKYDSQIQFNLSIPGKFKDSKSLQNKIDAQPHSFVTQSISSLEALGEIVDAIKPYGIHIIACIMTPSPKNKLSSEMIGLDWREYENDPADFIKQASKIADEILLTSPNSFESGLKLLRDVKGK